MEDKVFKLEKQLEELEKSNISLYINNVKKIKKNAIKLEGDINKLLYEEDNSDSEENNSESDNENENENEKDINDINIDNELKNYSELIENIDEDVIEEKTIEELNKIYQQIISIEKNIKLYQRLNCELNIKNI